MWSKGVKYIIPLNFTPRDWIDIGASLIVVWHCGRFIFTLFVTMTGANTHRAEITVTHNIALNASVEGVETDD